jgi:paraquat-inducible protein B
VSKQVNKTAIGAFVIGAIALVVGIVVVVGSGKLFVTTVPCVFYFDGSVQGLSVGSPVTFKGVQIGEVTDISLIFSPGEMRLSIPVRAVLYPEKIELKQGQRRMENLQRAIEKGLRAQLQTQSLITGQLMIALDFYPDSPTPELKGDGTVLEIPSVPTVIEQLAQVIKGIRFDEILEKLTKTADGIEKLVNNPDLMEGIQNLNSTVKDVQMLVRTLNDRVGPMTGSITGAADEYGALAKNLNRELTDMSAVLEKTLASAQTTAEKMEKTMANSAAITADGSPVMHELTRSLKELSDAAQSMRSLADYLERKPDSVIFGKGD